MIARLRDKVVQAASFIRKTRTPLPLILDSFRLMRYPFTATDHEGISLQLNPSQGDSFTFYEMLLRRDYLCHGIVINAGDTVVDIGANIGGFSVLAARLVGPSGRVISFEPNPATFQRLLQNIALNRLENVTAYPDGVGGEAGTLDLYMHTKSALASLYDSVDGRSSDPNQAVRVQVRILAEIFRSNHLEQIDMLKVDCEGAEYGIFDVMEPGFARRIKQVAMEVHAIPGRTYQGLVDRMAALGFDVRATYPLVAFQRDFDPATRSAN
ncbi:MAG: FkbM family methyltransferase [Isosphaeraceae bacterium]